MKAEIERHIFPLDSCVCPFNTCPAEPDISSLEKQCRSRSAGTVFHASSESNVLIEIMHSNWLENRSECAKILTPLAYSQWLNLVIYWLINHCTDWAQTDLMSFGCQFDFHDVICHVQPCNVDKRLRNGLFNN